MLQIKGLVYSPKARFNEDNSQEATDIRKNSVHCSFKLSEKSPSKNGSVATSHITKNSARKSSVASVMSRNLSNI